MAATPLSRSCDGHIYAQPHYVPREEALILASNQQRVLGPQAEVRVL